MTSGKIDFAKALANPRSLFGTPEQVLADPRIDREGKREILRRWAQKARADRFSPGGEPFLHRITAALAMVSRSPDGEPDAPARQTVEDIMRQSPDVLHPDHDLEEALARMKRNDLELLPVADGDEVVGTLEAAEIRRLERDEDIDLHEATVRDHMRSDVLYCFADDDPGTARAVTEEAGARGCCVVDTEYQLLGVVALADVAEEGKTVYDLQAGGTRHALTGGRARAEELGTPPSYSVRPKIKT